MNKLINISEASSIAIHSLSLIAKLDQSINATQIANLTGFSKNHLSKILQLLVKHDYLKSSRGPKGGFVLIKDPKEISLLEIYELIEGAHSDNYCFDHSPVCPFQDCIYGDIIQDISMRFIDAFKKRTIADIKLKQNISYQSILEKLNR